MKEKVCFVSWESSSCEESGYSFAARRQEDGSWVGEYLSTDWPTGATAWETKQVGQERFPDLADLLATWMSGWVGTWTDQEVWTDRDYDLDLFVKRETKTASRVLVTTVTTNVAVLGGIADMHIEDAAFMLCALS